MICLLAPPMIGSSGSNGESVPNETMKPVFLFEVIHTTVVPFLMQKNWLFFALGMPGLTLEDWPALVMSIVHGADAEPQVLAAVHKLAGSGSSHAYLLLAWAKVLAKNTIQTTTSSTRCFL